MLDMIALFLTMIAGHLVADYPLQGDTIAKGKNRTIDPARIHSYLCGVPWFYWMASHAATHAVAVGLATQSVWLGLAEFGAHFLIDDGKCRKFYGIHADQIAHALCKAAWVGVALIK